MEEKKAAAAICTDMLVANLSSSFSSSSSFWSSGAREIPDWSHKDLLQSWSPRTPRRCNNHWQSCATDQNSKLTFTFSWETKWWRTSPASSKELWLDSGWFFLVLGWIQDSWIFFKTIFNIFSPCVMKYWIPDGGKITRKGWTSVDFLPSSRKSSEGL